MLVYLVGLRGQYWVHRFILVVEEVGPFWLSRRLVHFCQLGRSSGPPGGRPHTRLKAGTPREAPTPAPTMKHRPHNSDSTQHEGQNNAGSTNLQNHWRGGKSWAAPGAPRQHRDSTSHPSSGAGAWTCHCKARPPGTCHWLLVNATPVGLLLRWDVFTQWRNECRTATATRASCHEAWHDWRSLPHYRGCVSSGGCLPLSESEESEMLT